MAAASASSAPAPGPEEYDFAHQEYGLDARSGTIKPSRPPTSTAENVDNAVRAIMQGRIGCVRAEQQLVRLADQYKSFLLGKVTQNPDLKPLLEKVDTSLQTLERFQNRRRANIERLFQEFHRPTRSIHEEL